MHTRSTTNGHTDNVSTISLTACAVPLSSVAFVVVGDPVLLGVTVLLSTVAGVVLQSWRTIAILPVVVALAIWSLLIPAAASGEELSHLATWALFVSLLTCPAPAAGAALGTAAGRVLPRHALRSSRHGQLPN